MFKENASKLYAVEMHVKPLSGAAIGDVGGAVVSVYVPSQDLESAISIAKLAVVEENFSILEIRFAGTVDIADLEGDEDCEIGLSDAREIIDSGEVRFGAFYAYE
jgi:hypothetical protein